MKTAGHANAGAKKDGKTWVKTFAEAEGSDAFDFRTHGDVKRLEKWLGSIDAERFK